MGCIKRITAVITGKRCNYASETILTRWKSQVRILCRPLLNHLTQKDLRQVEMATTRSWQQFTATNLVAFGTDGRWPQHGHLPSAFFRERVSPTCPAACSTKNRMTFRVLVKKTERLGVSKSRPS